MRAGRVVRRAPGDGDVAAGVEFLGLAEEIVLAAPGGFATVVEAVAEVGVGAAGWAGSNLGSADVRTGRAGQ